MRIYVAAQWDDRFRMGEMARCLRALGHQVISDWHEPEHTAEAYDGLNHEDACRIALNDLRQVQSAELLILDTHGGGSRGGRDFESGAAAMAGVWRQQPAGVWVVGPPTNVFTHWLGSLQSGETCRPDRMAPLPLLPFPATWAQVCAALAPAVAHG